MLLNAYSVYDRKAGHYHAPFFAVSDGAAVRSFRDLANDPQTTVGRHPGDYVLYRCGQFDDASGLLLHLSAVEHVTDALPLVDDVGPRSARAQSILPFPATGPAKDVSNG